MRAVLAKELRDLPYTSVRGGAAADAQEPDRDEAAALCETTRADGEA